MKSSTKSWIIIKEKLQKSFDFFMFCYSVQGRKRRKKIINFPELHQPKCYGGCLVFKTHFAYDYVKEVE